MSSAEIAAAPRHPQLMDPADPEELIEASIWWYPTLFPHRTAVLQHLLLCGGNGYEWTGDGQIRSVFSHLAPDYSTLTERQDRFAGDPGLRNLFADSDRRELLARTAIRDSAAERARVHGPVTVSWGRHGAGPDGLLAAAPARVHPRWQPLLTEAGQIFAAAWAVQAAAEARLRSQWDRSPSARVAQLLTRQIGRAWAADDLTDGELAACDQLLQAWRHPSWPARLDTGALQAQQAETRQQRAMIREFLGEPATTGRASGTQPARPPLTILASLAGDRLSVLAGLVRPAPFTGWCEWEWTLALLRQQDPAPGSGARDAR